MRRQRREEEDPVDEDDIPLHHKKPFGAGLKRKRVEFVRATDPDHAFIKPEQAPSRVNVGDLYASIVLSGQSSRASTPTGSVGSATGATKNNAQKDTTETASSEGRQLATPAAQPDEATPVCSVCSLPITTSVREHEATVAHQVSLAHSHPPSALDRSRMGLRTLAAQGWDPDARIGLGREGEGLRFPIKAMAKDDTLGVGATRPKPGTATPAKERPKPMTGKELKALAEKEKKKALRLQNEIYGNVDVERYLRGGT